MLLDLVDSSVVDQRALINAILKPIADFQVVRCLGQALPKGVVDAVLDQKAVGAHAGLSSISILCGDRALNGSVEISVIEDDEGSIAAELHRDLLHRGCR